jgi:hypothetical protein
MDGSGWELRVLPEAGGKGDPEQQPMIFRVRHPADSDKMKFPIRSIRIVYGLSISTDHSAIAFASLPSEQTQ